MSRETVGDEVRSGDLTVEGSVSFAGGTDLSTALAAKAPIDKPSFTGGKLYLARPSSGQDAVIQFRNEINIDSAAVALLGTADALSFRTGTTERMRIDSAGLITGTGTSLGAWTAYTPTLGGTGWAIGNGTATGYYCQIGKVVHFRFDITFGSTSTFGASAALRVSTPVTARNALLFQQIPVVIAYDVSAGKFYQMSAMVASTTGIDLYAYNGGANGEISELRSTNPFTWASGDIIRLQGSVEAA